EGVRRRPRTEHRRQDDIADEAGDARQQGVAADRQDALNHRYLCACAGTKRMLEKDLGGGTTAIFGAALPLPYGDSSIEPSARYPKSDGPTDHPHPARRRRRDAPLARLARFLSQAVPAAGRRPLD